MYEIIINRRSLDYLSYPQALSPMNFFCFIACIYGTLKLQFLYISLDTKVKFRPLVSYPRITEIFAELIFTPCGRDRHRLYLICNHWHGTINLWDKNFAYESWFTACMEGPKKVKIFSRKKSGCTVLCKPGSGDEAMHAASRCLQSIITCIIVGLFQTISISQQLRKISYINTSIWDFPSTEDLPASHTISPLYKVSHIK